ncbi:MAG: S-formylglutathione hydrolase [Pseudomonadota bacterium]|nr:S-formylglutathione hydrolase [Pseudomonadota bacterium]
MSLQVISSNKMFDGWYRRFSHDSITTHCNMTFSIYLPPQTDSGSKVPVLYWLSGLTCTDENFMQKAGAQRIAAELGIALVAADTSPRGDDIADDENGAYDLGLGAGFYVNATEAPWNAHFRMYDYIVEELPELIEANFPVSTSRSISGHSMGGHGALSIGLKNPLRYRSISAFSPITNPIQCPWGQKAFTAYLGTDKSSWKDYDSCELIQRTETEQLPVLIDQGDSDDFLIEQLKPQHLIQAAAKADYPIQLRMQDGYDHSYFFIASFIEDHLRFHAEFLAKKTA